MVTAEQQHAALVPAWIAAVGAALAAVLLPLASLAMQAPEGAAELLWVLGWTCATGAAVAAVSAVVVLGRERAEPTRRPAGRSALLVALAVALLMGTAWLYPFAGSGGGSG
ncbi:hypothetical protein [Agrococcus sp. BE272]|uniref:hypothetical protein n=1 Tax=Agrococcus sp. BE272 TaxID=2817727 RepID=UPI002855DB55|nr:hypothetical protein [Agrococcus sp. BE272]MDR7234051.1 lysylphosphatidylglycerol synthetase-like protein (DUF2156 family) [Agrococcus sp. BE272]